VRRCSGHTCEPDGAPNSAGHLRGRRRRQIDNSRHQRRLGGKTGALTGGDRGRANRLAKAVASIDPVGDLAGQGLAQDNRMEIPTLLSCALASACVASDGSVPSAMLRLVVQPAALVSAGAYNPAVTIYLTAKAQLLDAGGHERFWWCSGYRSPGVSYFALAANDGARPRTEMEWAWKTLAGRIDDDVFLNPAEVTLAPDGFAGEAFALSGTGEHVESGGARRAGIYASRAGSV
jgi:hypothetical protein